MSERPAMTAEELRGWELVRNQLTESVMVSKRATRTMAAVNTSDPNGEYNNGIVAARQCARDAVAARIAAMAQEEN